MTVPTWLASGLILCAQCTHPTSDHTGPDSMCRNISGQFSCRCKGFK